MEYRRSEITAGLMIILCSLLLLVTVVVVGNIGHIFRPQKTFTILFRSSGGLETSAPVMFAGVKIGQVTAVRIAPEQGNQIAVSVEVDREVEIKQDSPVTITGRGLLGEVFVAISPGSPEAPLLPEGGMLQGIDPLYFTDLTRTTNEVALKLQATIDRIYQIVANPATEATIEETLGEGKEILEVYQQLGMELQEATRSADNLLDQVGADLQKTLRRIDTVVQQMNKLVEQSQENIITSTENLKQVTGNLNRAVLDANQRISAMLETLQQKVTLLSEQLTLTITHLDGLAQRGTAVVDENRPNLFLMVQDLKETSQNLKELSDTVKRAPWKLIKLFGREEEESDQVHKVILQDSGQIRRYGKQ